MFDTSQLAMRAADAIKGQCDLNHDQYEIVTYSLELVFIGLLGFVLAVAVGLFFGVGLLTFLCMLSGALVRTFAGGGHCSAGIRCAVASIIFAPLALFSHLLGGVLNSFQATLLVFIVTMVLLVAVHLWAPAEAPNKPIKNSLHRSRLRLIAFVVVLLIASVSLMAKNDSITIALLFGAAFQVFAITPLGVKMISLIDRFLLQIGIR